MSKAKLTITEALAEVKTIEKRIQKKREFVMSYLYRQEALKDPLAKEGGSGAAIDRELQAIRDLADRHVAIRAAIARANAETTLSVNGTTRSVADWLTFRREVAPTSSQFLREVRGRIDAVRSEASKRGFVTVAAGAEARPGDVVVNLDEMTLAKDIEAMEETLGQLDGALSLKNATTFVDL